MSSSYSPPWELETSLYILACHPSLPRNSKCYSLVSRNFRWIYLVAWGHYQVVHHQVLSDEQRKEDVMGGACRNETNLKKLRSKKEREPLRRLEIILKWILPHVAANWLVLHHIWEVPGSNLTPKTGSPDWVFEAVVGFLSLSTQVSWWHFKLGHDRFLSHRFHLLLINLHIIRRHIFWA
jgi:hypothetical protein